VTKLGRLVKDGKIKSIEEIYLHSLAIKEYQIVDHFFKSSPSSRDGKVAIKDTKPSGSSDKSTLRDEVLKISSVQKQTRAGQRTRFKAYVIIGDSNGHCGLGVKCAKEVATAIRGAIILAKISLVPVRRGYWGANLGDVHTVPMKISGKCGSVMVRLVPAPRGSGIIAAPVPTKLLNLAGIHDVYTNTAGHTKTLGNFVKATFDAVRRTYGYLTPDLWEDTQFVKNPMQVYTDFLSGLQKKQQ